MPVIFDLQNHKISKAVEGGENGDRFKRKKRYRCRPVYAGI